MARRKVKWSLTALENKLAILSYWLDTNRSSNFPDKLNYEFKEALDLASIFPFSGVPTEKDHIRFVIVRNYRLYYEINIDAIRVLLIWDTRRNPKDLQI